MSIGYASVATKCYESYVFLNGTVRSHRSAAVVVSQLKPYSELFRSETIAMAGMQRGDIVELICHDCTQEPALGEGYVQYMLASCSKLYHLLCVNKTLTLTERHLDVP